MTKIVGDASGVKDVAPTYKAIIIGGILGILAGLGLFYV